MAGWEWDESLYSGSAAYYARGRVAYPPELADALANALRLDGSGRFLDVGCGPGSLTLLLATRFEAAVGLDADPDMLAEASRLAAAKGITTTRWAHERAEDLPAGLGAFRLVTFAQSFHWLDRPRVAAAVRGMLEPGGACLHVHATTHRGTTTESAPPHERITELVREYLGETRRAGRGVLPEGTAGGETAIYRGAGFTGPQRIEVPGSAVVRDIDDVVATVFSLSSSAPHLFGDRVGAFESELRSLLTAASPSGKFREQMREFVVDVWRP
ncbi:class I SAM-dependent methyltransferase [Amycolatopsis sp. DSM 110486]|uniref:class I SAM-dependent methyltransferase n=1 Tax=Amycolatopsis sp. DSM 110486 TaxID=2865832 RepID=UPI001C6A67D5|nr:class I SAM-dependent methyltransferase [Amycolatopsis sp. DSM 110486]QYN22157.1 class I SAM-dependent methyltransferase [Amycolatopsis sp. DSM 110486]